MMEQLSRRSARALKISRKGDIRKPLRKKRCAPAFRSGLTLIDTAEIYSDGRSEKLIGRVIAGQRDGVFLVSKVWPNHVMGNGVARACDASLGRLGTDHLDLYMLHWPSRDAELSSIVAAFESLRAAGKIRAWAYPTSRSAIWKTYSVFHTAIAARPIRSFITSAIAPSSMTCCHPTG
jgi:aryl-alcohol dehydrogenase-like predicted oxidoreductase